MSFFSDQVDLDTVQVRDHLEALIETLVGKGLDDVPILCPRPGTLHHDLHGRHHGRLKASLVEFNDALCSVLKSDNCSQATPTSAHSNVKEAVQSLQRDTAVLLGKVRLMSVIYSAKVTM